MAAAAPFVVSALVGTAVAKVGGALIGQVTGNEQLGNIVGAIGGAYAGGMAGGFINPATGATSAGATAANTAFNVADDAGNLFSAFDAADAANLAGSMGNSTAFASVTPGVVSASGANAASSAPIFGGSNYANTVVDVPTTAVGGGVGGGMNTASSAGGAAASAGKGLMGSFSDFIQTPGGMLMAGSTIQGIAGGLSQQSQLDQLMSERKRQEARTDELSRVVSVEPIRLKQRDSEGVYSTSKYGVA